MKTNNKVVKKTNKKLEEDFNNFFSNAKSFYSDLSYLKANENIYITGNLPARLIPIPKSWPPINNEKIVSKTKKESKEEDYYSQENQLKKINYLKLRP